MYCDVVSMFVMLLVLVFVTSTWYTTTHSWLSRDQARLTDDSVSVVPSISATLTFLGCGGIARVHIIKKVWFLMRTDSLDNFTQLLCTYMHAYTMYAPFSWTRMWLWVLTPDESRHVISSPSSFRLTLSIVAVDVSVLPLISVNTVLNTPVVLVWLTLDTLLYVTVNLSTVVLIHQHRWTPQDCEDTHLFLQMA